MNDSHPDSAPEPSPAPPPGTEWDAALFSRRPVQAKKVSYGLPWLHFALAVSFAVATWVFLKPSVGRLIWPKAVTVDPRRAEAFVAIAYDGISWKNNEVTPDLFREHLRALRAAGYVPITLADVDGLMIQGHPLPQKAVLLTMDQSRKTSYFTTHAILRRFGWNAVMFLWTKPIADGDSAAMLWPYIHNMVRSGLWEIGAQSHDGFRRVKTSSKGLLGGFMTSPIYFPSEARYESLEEFQQRLRIDHDQCLAQIETNLGVKPLAYAYPYGNFGQFQHRSVVTRPINMALVSERYRLAFILGNLALNTRNSNPHLMNRLRVQPFWTGRELVQRLDNAWPKSVLTLEKKGEPLAAAWIVDWGRLDRDSKGGLALSAATNATGAKMWLAGSDLLADFNAKIRFRLEDGQFGLYLRASADDEAYVYLGLNKDGEAWLGQMSGGRERLPITENVSEGSAWVRQKQMGSARFTLASSHISINPAKDHVLEVFLRNQFFSASLDGQELFRNRNLLRGEQLPGLIGVSVWSPRPGTARARLTGIEVREATPTVALWSPGVDNESRVFKWIADKAFRFTILSPQWIDAASPNSRNDVWPDLGLYRLLAKVHHLRLFPQVSIADERGMLRITPSRLADRVARERLDGVLINLSAMSSATLPTLATWLRPCAAALAEKGARLLIQLPASFETHSQIGPLLAILPGVQVAAVAGSPLPLGPVGTSGQVVRAETVPAPDPEEDLPLFYIIPPAGGGGMLENDETKCTRLQQEGMAAYLDGQYNRAAELWQEWKRLEPDNPKASMLLGDALSRKGDLAGAIEEYNLSLELDPGQISLAIRRADFYSILGQPQRTLDSLNLYGRLFPGNAEILMAQAHWLGANGRHEEGAAVARRLVGSASDNVDALALLLGLTASPEERQKTMDQLVAAGANPKNQMALGQAIWKFALTALPHSDSLAALVETIAEKTKDPRIKELYGRIKLQSEPVTEKMNGALLSTNRWWTEGAALTTVTEAGTVFSVSPNYTEGTLRLLGSLRLRNSFIEALVGPTRGNLWLYACRTPEYMARFGFSDDGTLRIQTWKANRLLAEHKLEYTRNPTPVRLRLEVKGQGLMGYVDGKPAFPESLQLPPEMGFGWIGLAVHATTRGQASAVLGGLSAGPLPMRLGVIPVRAGTDAENDALVNTLRQDVASLTALCPEGITLQADGIWASLPGSDREINRVFARYYRLWLTPMIECQAPGAVKPEMLEARAREMGVDGFILKFKEWPGDSWVASLRQAMRDSPLRLLVVATTSANNALVRIQPLARGVEFNTGDGPATSARVIRRAGLSEMPAMLSSQAPLLITY